MAADRKGNGSGAALSAILFLAFTLYACSTTAPAETVDAAPARVIEPSQLGSLEIVIDWSGSCVHTALEEAWNTVKNELPSILGSEPDRLRLNRVDEDGWSPRPLTEISLPVFNLPERQKQQALGRSRALAHDYHPGRFRP